MFAVAEEFCAISGDTGATDFLLRKRVAAPKRVPTIITTIMAAVFQLPVGLLGATDQSGWVSTEATGKAGANGANGVGAAACWSHGFFEPRVLSGKGPTDRDLPPGKLEFGGGTASGTEGGFCDWNNTGADGTGAGLVCEDAGNIAGIGASIFSVDGGDALVGAMGGTFTSKGGSDGTDDGLFADGAAGWASSDIAKGEI